MTESVCAQARPAALGRMEFIACSEAAKFALAMMEDHGRFSRGKARSPAFKARHRRGLRNFIIRIFSGSGEEGAEAHTHYGTVRGLSQILGLHETGGHDYLKTWSEFGFFEFVGEKLRRHEAKTKSETPGSNEFWWCPSVWRIAPFLCEIINGIIKDGTELANPPLENQKPTWVLPSVVEFSPTLTLGSWTGVPKVQDMSREALAFPEVAEEQPKESARQDLAAVQALAQTAIQSMQVELPPEHPVHPEGRDLGYLFGGCATPAVVDRVARRNGIDLSALKKFYRKGDAIRRAENLPTIVTSVEEPPNPKLEPACRNFERSPPKRERPIVPQIPRRKPPADDMPHPIGHNGPPVSETPAEGDAYDQIMAKYGIPPRPKTPS